MFLPSISLKLFKNCKRCLIVFPLPELKFWQGAILLKRKFSWMGFTFYQAEADSLVIGPVLGAPPLSFLMEILAAGNIREVLALGWAGATRLSQSIPQIFLPLKALSFEGVSKLLSLKTSFFYPDSQLLNSLKRNLKTNCIFYEEGAILSTDFPPFFEELARRKIFSVEFPEIKAIDMETSALFSLSRHFGIQSCAIHFFIDKLGCTSHKLPNKSFDSLRITLLPVIKEFLKAGF